MKRIKIMPKIKTKRKENYNKRARIRKNKRTVYKKYIKILLPKQNCSQIKN